MREMVDDKVISNGRFAYWYLLWLTPMCRNDDPTPKGEIHNLCASIYALV